MRKSAVLSAADAVVQMLAAGDWQCALELLEQEEEHLRRKLIENWTAGRDDLIALDFTDLTQLHRTIESSLAGLAPELRWKIARKLLEANTKWNCSVMPPSQSPR